MYLLVPNAAVVKKCYATRGKKKMHDKREIFIILKNYLVFVTFFFCDFWQCFNKAGSAILTQIDANISVSGLK